MGIFKKLKKSKTELSEEQKKFNQIWKLWEDGQAESPYAELMTYQSEINNGGHDQYFLNVGETSDLQKEMSALKAVLPEVLKSNLQTAFEAYSALAVNEDDEDTEETLEQCDNAFYENEENVNRILTEYASRIEF